MTTEDTKPDTLPVGPPTYPRPGDIVLFENAKGIARIIPLVTRSRYYHVALYSGNDRVVEARPQGVIERDQHDPIGGPFHAFIPVDRERAAQALEWARAKIGDPYDPFDLPIMFLERVFRHLRLNYAPKGRFTCGEFVVRAFRETGGTLLPGLKAEEVEPADFEQLHPIRLNEPN